MRPIPSSALLHMLSQKSLPYVPDWHIRHTCNTNNEKNTQKCKKLRYVRIIISRKTSVNKFLFIKPENVKIIKDFLQLLRLIYEYVKKIYMGLGDIFQMLFLL